MRTPPFVGMVIAGFVLDRIGGAPWRLAAQDHLAALDAPTAALSGTAGPTPWDPRLQEAIVATLLGDL